MKFFIETTDIQAIKVAHSWGIIDGVVLDRLQCHAGGVDVERRMTEVCPIVDGPVIVSAAESEAGEIVREGRDLASRHTNAVTTVPVTPDGMQAVRRLSDEGIRIGAGPVQTPAQALVALKSGAEYILVPMGDQLDDVIRMIETYGFDSEAIVLGIRGPEDVLSAVRVGAHGIAVSIETIRQMFSQS